MKKRNYIAVSALLAFNTALAQSLPNPEVLGIKLGMDRDSAIRTIKDKYPKARFTPLKKDFANNVGELIYEGQYVIDLGANKTASTDKITLTFLPDDTVLAVKREITYHPGKQKTADIYIALNQKFGNPVYFVSEDQTRFEDQAMWSNKMLPGLSLIGSSYSQGVIASRSDFGTITPYPYCEMEMSSYTSESFSPKVLYTSLTSKSDFARNKANFAKGCGTALWVHNQHEKKLFFNAIRTTIYLMNLEEAPNKILQLPDMLAQNAKTLRLTPVTQPLNPQGSTPDL